MIDETEAALSTVRAVFREVQITRQYLRQLAPAVTSAADRDRIHDSDDALIRISRSILEMDTYWDDRDWGDRQTYAPSFSPITNGSDEPLSLMELREGLCGELGNLLRFTRLALGLVGQGMQDTFRALEREIETLDTWAQERAVEQ